MMATVYNVNERLNKMRAKLYPSYLPGTENTYIARTSNEAAVTLEDICAAMKNRGGYDGSYEDALQTVKHFLMEMAYQLCDGFSVNMKYFSIHPNIGGTFQSEREGYDPKKHPVAFRFQSLKALRKLQDDIAVIIEGYADTQGYIAEFTDTDIDATNSVFVPGNQFVLHGSKIKVAGDDPACGVYLVPVEDRTKAVKITRIAENSSGKIIGIVPESTGYSQNRIEIRTQFSGGSFSLKTPRSITSGFVLEES
jgi:hypothetical protein